MSDSVNQKVEVSEKDEILKEANSNFIKEYTLINNILCQEEANIFNTRYSIGKRVDHMRLNPDKYGPKAVERMEVAIGKDRCVVYSSLVFSQRYTATEVKAISEARNSEGRPLMWTHITHLIRIPDKAMRDELLKLTLENSWTTSDLLKYVQDRLGGKQKTKAGKPLARPTNISGFVEQQVVALEQIIAKKTKLWAGKQKPDDVSFLDMLNRIPTEEIDDNFLVTLENLEVTYKEAASELSSMEMAIYEIRSSMELRKANQTGTIEDLDQDVPFAEVVIDSVTDNIVDDPLNDMADKILDEFNIAKIQKERSLIEENMEDRSPKAVTTQSKVIQRKVGTGKPGRPRKAPNLD